MRWLVIGIVSFALLLGFLVGASHTPVAGVAITATFGIIATSFVLYQKATIEKAIELNKKNFDQLEKRSPLIDSAFATLGKALTAFALAFAVGLTGGISARLSLEESNVASAFPWEGSEYPVSSRSAVDWIVVQERLRARGYSDQQVRAIYAMHVKGRTEHSGGRYHTETDEPISPLLSDAGPPPKTKATLISHGGKPPEKLV